MDEIAQSLRHSMNALPPRAWLAVLVAVLIPAAALYALAGWEAYRWARRIEPDLPPPHDDSGLRRELAAANSQVRDLIAQREEMQAQMDALVAASAGASDAEIDRLPRRVAELTSETARLRSQLAARGHTAELEQAQTQVRRLTADNQRLQDQLDQFVAGRA